MKNLVYDSDKEMRPWLQLVCVFVSIFMLQFMVAIQLSVIVGFVAGFMDGISDNASGGTNVLAILESQNFIVITQILTGLVTVLAIPVIYKSLVKRKPSAIGFPSIKKGFKNLLIGLLIGVGMISILVITLMLVGEYKFTGITLSYDLLIGLVMYIFVGLNEELLVRGAFQHIIYRKHSIIWAILIPSVLFSIMHFLNPNIDVLSGINLFLAGVFFAILTYKTGNIWMSVGVHITWNYTMGTLFGIEVSGVVMGDSLIQMKRTSDTLLNGGNFGLEGGILCTVLLVVGIIVAGIMDKKEYDLDEEDNILNKEIQIEVKEDYPNKQVISLTKNETEQN